MEDNEEIENQVNSNDEEYQELLQEIKNEQHISPFEEDSAIIGYIKEAMYDINKCGPGIDYDTDLDARSLLKNRVLYAREKRLAEFKQLYAGEYAKLQAEYYKPTNI